ncbi:hypothetical protein [Nostoc sp.]|uniref:hypothetical protein n=1 Tax=Nostoc sp. TaxID=1180 RepID=UPI003FA5FD1C
MLGVREPDSGEVTVWGIGKHSIFIFRISIRLIVTFNTGKKLAAIQLVEGIDIAAKRSLFHWIVLPNP